MACSNCAGICWTNGCTGACTPTGCAPHACQNSCNNCSAACKNDCSGCSGGCQGCNNTCNNTCSGCKNTCQGCSGCSGSCNTLCNTGCSNSTATSLSANLALTTFIEAANMQQVQNLLLQEVARRPSVSSITALTLTQGNTVTKNEMTTLLGNLTKVGHGSSYVATVGDIISANLGRDVIQKALDAYNQKVGI